MVSVLDLAAILYFLFIIYTANQVQIGAWNSRGLRLLLYNVLGLLMLLALFTTQVVIALQNAPADQPQLSVSGAFVGMATGLVGVLAGYAVLVSITVRQAIARLSGAGSAYDPESHVHTTAVILCLTLVGGTILSYIIGGGQSGLAESIQTTGVSAGQPVFQAVVFVLAAFLGVGYAIRRDNRRTFERLGLRLPTQVDWARGAAAGLALYIGSLAFTAVWQLLVSPEQFAQQTQAAEQFARSLNTLPLALLVSFSAALGEEVLIRGALQPIFGIGLSSAFFTLLHTQYLGTPTMLLIFGISVGLGLVRRQYSTTAAIIAHFVYNGIPFVLLLLLGLGGTPS